MAEVSPFLIMVAFLVLSAFFSSSEAAFLSLQKTRIAHLVNTDVPGAKRIARMIEQPERLLSTILLGNNLVNVAFTAIVTAVIVTHLGETQGVVIATVVGTIFLLIVGEILPKSIALRNSERVVFWYAQPLKWIEILLWPLIIVLQWVTNKTNSLLGRGTSGQQSITEGELRSLIDIGEAEGTFEPDEAEMLENVFRFGDRQVREVMTPRTEIVPVPHGASLRQFLDVYSKNTHTRFPVYKNEMDNIVGIISVKDVLKTMSARKLDYEDSVTDVVRNAYYVPETKRIAELFAEMRRLGNQMAIAIDEYGGLAGVATLKRLTEEVVGPVGEEGEAPEEEYEAIDENTFQIEGSMSIDEANEELGLELIEGDYDTVAGFVLDTMGQIPRTGEQFEYKELKFEIIQMANLKIETIKVTRPQSTESRVEGETNTD